MFTRIVSLLERQRRAHRFGIPYTRDKNWQPPSAFKINSAIVPLSLPHDRGTSLAIKDIFISDVYGLETFKNPPNTVIDVGAHAGLFSLAARAYFPRATIHAYEPNAALRPHLEANARAGSYSAFFSAMGSKRARAHLQYGEDSVFTQCVANASGTIEIIPLHEAIDRIAPGGNLDLLKLDCEGAEWEIFQDRAAMARVGRLTMEYHLTASRSLDDFRSLLRETGFKIGFLHEDGETNGRVWASKP